MANTPVLNTQNVDTASRGVTSYSSRVGEDNEMNTILATIDAFAGHVTASMCSFFECTGSASDLLGDGGVLGLEYTRDTRVIQEIVAYCSNSGSGGVTTIDVLVQQGATQPANFSTVFPSSNNADRIALSASAGNFGIAKKASFVSGSNTVWPAGTLLQVKLITAAGAAGINGQKGLTVQVYWKPTGSYGTAQ